MLFSNPSYSDTLRSDVQPSYRDSLMHHGIKGQKWGVRRYQNSDGSYTAAGKKRRNSIGSTTGMSSNTKNNLKKAAKIAGGIALVGGGAYLANRAMGNPIGKEVEYHKANKYMKEAEATRKKFDEAVKEANEQENPNLETYNNTLRKLGVLRRDVAKKEAKLADSIYDLRYGNPKIRKHKEMGGKVDKRLYETSITDKPDNAIEYYAKTKSPLGTKDGERIANAYHQMGRAYFNRINEGRNYSREKAKKSTYGAYLKDV